MTIHLPEDLASSIRAEVLSGHFASEDEMVAEAVRDYLRQRRQGQPEPKQPATGGIRPDPVLGSMRDAADELDEIVAEAMRQRQAETWREISVE